MVPTNRGLRQTITRRLEFPKQRFFLKRGRHSPGHSIARHGLRTLCRVELILAAIVVGLCLGMLGSGGSTITVPALVFIVGEDEKTAIAGSLFVVGIVALVGSLPRIRRGQARIGSILRFGVPGALGASLAARLARNVEGTTQLLVFGVVVLIAATTMLRQRPREESPRRPAALGWFELAGFLVGALSGFIGIGGGFLIVPALLLLGGLALREAIGTSLGVIALNAFGGFARYFTERRHQDVELDWSVLLSFAAIGALASLAGDRLSQKLPQNVLRKLFAIVMIGVGIAILVTRWPR